MPIKRYKFVYDEDGYKYKTPARTCKRCALYPCFQGIETLETDFAKYGCVNYAESECSD